MILFEINQQVGSKIRQTDWQVWFKKIDRNLKLKKNYSVSVGVVGDGAMRQLNWSYRRKDKTTDVLSFAERDTTEAPGTDLGEIIISYPQAKRQAKMAGHSVSREVEWLLIHGFLHLLGYNHEKNKEAAVMERLQEKIYHTTL